MMTTSASIVSGGIHSTSGPSSFAAKEHQRLEAVVRTAGSGSTLLVFHRMTRVCRRPAVEVDPPGSPATTTRPRTIVSAGHALRAGCSRQSTGGVPETYRSRPRNGWRRRGRDPWSVPTTCRSNQSTGGAYPARPRSSAGSAAGRGPQPSPQTCDERDRGESMRIAGFCGAMRKSLLAVRRRGDDRHRYRRCRRAATNGRRLPGGAGRLPAIANGSRIQYMKVPPELPRARGRPLRAIRSRPVWPRRVQTPGPAGTRHPRPPWASAPEVDDSAYLAPRCARRHSMPSGFVESGDRRWSNPSKATPVPARARAPVSPSADFDADPEETSSRQRPSCGPWYVGSQFRPVRTRCRHVVDTGTNAWSLTAFANSSHGRDYPAIATPEARAAAIRLDTFGGSNSSRPGGSRAVRRSPMPRRIPSARVSVAEADGRHRARTKPGRARDVETRGNAKRRIVANERGT